MRIGFVDSTALARIQQYLTNTSILYLDSCLPCLPPYHAFLLSLLKRHLPCSRGLVEKNSDLINLSFLPEFYSSIVRSKEKQIASLFKESHTALHSWFDKCVCVCIHMCVGTYMCGSCAYVHGFVVSEVAGGRRLQLLKAYKLDCKP